LSVSASVRSWDLIKIISLLNFVFCCCISLFGLCLFGLNIGGLSIFFFMLAETVLLSLNVVHILAKYCMHLYTLRQQQITTSSTVNSNNNENRLLITYYCEFIFDILTLSIDICYHLQMLLYCNIFLSMASLVICMQLKPLIDELMQRIKRHNLYRVAMLKMEQKYPLLTKHELGEKFKKNNNYSPDEVCSICWEKFEKARCGHLFHQNCLRSWLEQDPSCPVCRLPLHDETTPSTPTPAVPNVPPQPAASFNLFWPSFTVGANARTGQQQETQPTTDNIVPRQRNHLFRFDGSRYASWLPSFSVEVTHTHNFPFRFGRQRLSTTQLNTIAQNVQQIFPQIPYDIILNDLQRTQSIDLTINNIIDRRIQDLEVLEQQADTTGNNSDSSDTDSFGSLSSTSSLSSSDVEDSDTRQTTNTDHSTLSETQIDNILSDQETYTWPLDHGLPLSIRKQHLIAHMRRCYVKRERDQLQIKSDAKFTEDGSLLVHNHLEKMTDNRVRIWAKAEPFTFGALNSPPPPEISSSSLKGIVKYMKKNEKCGYPKMNYILWRHIACQKLHMSEELAWMYFESYSLLTNGGNAKRTQLDAQMAKATTSAEIERSKDSRKVDSLAFVLLLFLQSFHHIDLKSTLSRDEWPNRKRGSVIDARKNRIYDEQTHQLFIQAHLDDMLNIVADTEQYNEIAQATLSLEAVTALSFIFECSLSENHTKLYPLQALMNYRFIQDEIGMSTVGNNSVVPFKGLSNLIRRSLISNPFQVGQTMKLGTLLPLPFDNPTHEQRSGRVLCNSNFADEQHRFVLMTMINRSLNEQHLPNVFMAEFRIHRCSYSYIYIYAPLRCVEIRKCHNVTIVFGSIETTLKITDCENVSISAVCRRLVISQCRSSSFYILTPTRPLVQLNCSNLLFAPYNTSYIKLPEHMEKTGLCKDLNLWNKPLITHPAGYRSDLQSGEKNLTLDDCWSLMNPDDFYPISTIRSEDQQKDCFIPLPIEYQNALDKRQKSISLLANEITDAQLNQEQRQRFQRFVVTHFESWLEATGNKKILDHLSSLVLN
ncbi:unnamed protein product, partial [Didymodactylos carnosus]